MTFWHSWISTDMYHPGIAYWKGQGKNFNLFYITSLHFGLVVWALVLRGEGCGVESARGFFFIPSQLLFDIWHFLLLYGVVWLGAARWYHACHRHLGSRMWSPAICTFSRQRNGSNRPHSDFMSVRTTLNGQMGYQRPVLKTHHYHNNAWWC